MDGYFHRQSWFWLKPWLLRISFSWRLHCSAHTCAHASLCQVLHHHSKPCRVLLAYPRHKEPWLRAANNQGTLVHEHAPVLLSSLIWRMPQQEAHQLLSVSGILGESHSQSCCTWEPVSMELRRAPVWVFQNLMLRSAVPPPEASRFDWKGHQASAFTAAACAVILCIAGPPAYISQHLHIMQAQTKEECAKLYKAPCRLQGLSSGNVAFPQVTEFGKEDTSTAVDCSGSRAERCQSPGGIADACMAKIQVPRTCGAPNVQEVVVAPRGQLGAAGGPLEAAHLLLMAPQHPCDVLPDPAQQTRLSLKYSNPASTMLPFTMLDVQHTPLPSLHGTEPSAYRELLLLHLLPPI